MHHDLLIVVWLVVFLTAPVDVTEGQSRKEEPADSEFDWPGFRGPRVDGVSRETNVFGNGGTRLETAWKRALGKGYSGIAVSGNHAVTMFSDGKADVVIAVDCADGHELWRYVLDETYRGHDGSQDGPIATPYVFHGMVFALAPRGKLVALDLSTGTEIWSTDLVKDYGAVKPHRGFGTSPLVVSGVLVVQVGATEGMVFGFDPQTARRLWAAGKDDVYYQSPVPILQNGVVRLLTAGNKELYCIDPRSGGVLWKCAHEGSGEYGAVCLVPVPLGERGVLLAHRDDASKVLELSPDREDGEPAIRWEERSIRKNYSVSVYHDEHIYGYSGRIFSCVDATTGKAAWRSRQPADGFPIVVDGHLVIMSKAGMLSVADAAQDDYREVARLQVFDEMSWAPPSFAAGAIYVRSFGEIARINVRPTESTDLTRPDAGGDIAGTRLGQFLTRLKDAPDKTFAIDQFISSTGPFPMIEREGRVVFVYRGPGEDLAIGGDLSGFGHQHPMQRVTNTDLFYYAARLEPDARISYAVIRDFKAIPDPLNPKRAILRGIDDEMELDFSGGEMEVSWMAMPKWQPPQHFEPVDRSRRGRIESHKLHSAALEKQVDVEVYLPAEYQKEADRFPVVYVHGGKLAQGALQIPLTLDNLIGRTIEPVIAVFINHDPPFMGWDGYAEMCAQELPAFIDSRYRTVKSRDARAHVAWGYGGLAATYTALSHAANVGKLGLQSPLILQTSYIEPVMKNANEAPIKIYFDWGKYDTRSPLEFWNVAECGRQLDEYFRDRGYRPLGGQANDGSGVPSWRNRTDDMLESLFPVSARK